MTRRKSAALLSYLSQSTDCAAELNVYEVILLGRLQQLSFKVGDEDMRRVQEVMELLSITQFAPFKAPRPSRDFCVYFLLKA